MSSGRTTVAGDYAGDSPDEVALVRAAKRLGIAMIARRGALVRLKFAGVGAPDGEDRYAIAAGSLEAPTGLSVAMNIYCDDKGDYYDIKDGLPQK